MTNQDYLQWEPMLKRLARKYKNNKFNLDMEELIQIGALGLINVFDTYKDDKGTSRLSYYYTCVERYILKEFQGLGRAKRFCNNLISLNKQINNTDDEIYLEETVSDENINVENTALDTLIIKEYIDEIDKVLKGNQRDIIFLKIFDDKTDNEIADILNIKVNKVSKTYSEARNKLVRKSNLIRLRFFELERSKVNSWKSTDWDKDIYYENKIESLRRELEKENRKLLENKMSINKMISKKI